MALTASQQASRLFKKSFGAGETLTSRDFFEEPKLGREIIFSDQIWSESSLIPTTAPSLVSGASSGVVQYFEKQTLTHLAGSNNRAYFSANLIDAISFNFGDGTYNYSLYKNDGTTSIAFGDGDWLVDTAAGLLTFYGTLPSGVTSVLPPKISFYKYLGSKGVSTSSGTIAGVTAGNGLSGGGTANYITLDVNLGVNSGLTFSGDEIIIDNTIIPGNGLTANGYSLDVNVNSDSLEISNDLLRLKDTIDGDRIFQDSLTVNGSLIVNGTVSYIQTETLLIEDNIITLNATFSGSPFLNAGIEVIRGNQPTAALIWNESTDTWTAGLSGSEVDILLNAGLGLTKSGPTVSLDFNSIVGTGLTHNGNQISVDILGINGTPVSQYGTSSVTVGNNSTTGLAITSTPNQYSRIQVFINGQLQKLGDGTFSNVDCYFSNDGGLSALVLGSVSSGNTLYWNGFTAKFELDNNDEVIIVYEN
jgi:hypothetical protein